MTSLVLLRHPALTPLRVPTAGSGVLIGLACAAAVVIGPAWTGLFVLMAVISVAEWTVAPAGAAERLRGLGVGALVGLAAAKGLFATAGWADAGATGFTRAAWEAAVVIAPVPLLLALLDTKVSGRRRRSVAAIALAVAAVGIVLVVSRDGLG